MQLRFRAWIVKDEELSNKSSRSYVHSREVIFTGHGLSFEQYARMVDDARFR